MKHARKKTSGCADARKANQADLAAFCNAVVPSCAAPWSDGGYTYATDGAVLLRMKARANTPAANHPATGTANAALASYPAPDARRFEPLPPSITPATALIPCPECHGSGAVLSDKNKPIFCQNCLGEKTTWDTRPVQIGNQLFAAHYLARLSNLPGVLIATLNGHSPCPLRIAFDDGEGLLMPRRAA